MKSLSDWMSEYAISHQNETNILIHKFCVPLIMFSVIGLLWSVPVPEFLEKIHINFASLFIFFALIFYITLSLKYFLLLLPVVGLMYFGVWLLDQTNWLLIVSISIFVVSWVFQFIGHKIEGKKPSFLKDLSFLLIGPLWVVKKLGKF